MSPTDVSLSKERQERERVTLGEEPLALWLFDWQLSWSGRHCGFTAMCAGPSEDNLPFAQLCTYFLSLEIGDKIWAYTGTRERKKPLWHTSSWRGLVRVAEKHPRSVEFASKTVMIPVVIMTRSLGAEARKPWLLRYSCVFRSPFQWRLQLPACCSSEPYRVRWFCHHKKRWCADGRHFYLKFRQLLSWWMIRWKNNHLVKQQYIWEEEKLQPRVILTAGINISGIIKF